MGNKNRLVDTFIIPTMKKFMGRKPEMFSDLFLGTGSVAAGIKNEYGCQIIGSDLQLYSVIINKHLIENIHDLKFSKLKKIIPEIKKLKEPRIGVCDYLNNLPGVEGFIFNNYCPSGKFKRKYFTDNNGKRGDAIRLKIDEWSSSKSITKKEYYYLLACLLESIDKVANTTSVYGAYLKQIKRAAQKDMIFSDIGYHPNHNKNKIFQLDANKLARRNIEHDIVYLDPPYNSRQYASNYHVLETIAEYDTSIELTGKTGMRNYDNQKSKYSRKGEAYNALKDLIENINANYIFVSYTSEGLLKPKEIEEILSKHGEYKLEKFSYRRYKSDKTENRNHKDGELFEHLHCLKIS